MTEVLFEAPGAQASTLPPLAELVRSPKVLRALTTGFMNVGLAAFVSVASLSLLRIFVDAHLQTPILIGLACGLGIPAVARLLHVPAWFALIASTVVEAIVLGAWFSSVDGSSFGNATFGIARESMFSALKQVNDIVAPSPSLIGFGIVVSLVTWLVSLTADLMCFGVPTPIGALLTPSAVAIASSNLTSRKDTRHQGVWIFALIVSLGIYLISVALRERARRTQWFADTPGSLLQTGGVLALAFCLLGFGADQTAKRLAFDEKSPAIDFRVGSSDTDRQRVITSPLVSLQRRLLNQSNNEQFSVSSRASDGTDAPSYWRLTALDEFNGESWQSTGEYRSVSTSGRLGKGGSDDAGALRQTFAIVELGTESLPAAYRPVNYRGIVPGVSYAEATNTLLAKSPLRRGDTYSVASNTPGNLDPSKLTEYDPVLAKGDPSIALPLSFPDRVRQLALEITKDQPTVVQKARALQDFFRTEFTYSLDVPAGSSEPALERFLFADRKGYCEQFAGAFAAMARSIGIPARVAVGFTPGRYDSGDRRYHVTGKNSHAWPEIRLADGSWFPFEPTPGRGFPGLEQSTGVPAQDLSEEAQPLSPPTTVDAANPVPTTTLFRATPVRPVPVRARKSNHAPLLAVLMVLAVLAGLAAAFLLRRRGHDESAPASVRRRTPPAPSLLRPAARRIDKAWSITERRLPGSLEAHETENSVATRLEGAHPELPELASLAQRARYGETTPAQVSDDDADRAEHLADAIAGRAD
jgi:transglutaminase-like putative cysteine protease